MAIGGPTKPLNVTPEEKQNLSMLARRPKSAQAMAMRAGIVLGCSEVLSNGEVAKRLRITGGDGLLHLFSHDSRLIWLQQSWSGTLLGQPIPGIA